jgi:putative transposase
LRLEVHRLRTGVSWYEAKAAIIRSAIREYLAHPSYLLNPTAYVLRKMERQVFLRKT